MSTRDPERQSAVAILLATGFMLALVGCGGSGMSGAGSGVDASVTVGQGGAGGGEETGGAGGTTALAGNSGQGGVSGLGGNTASGGQSGSMVSPRVPKNHRPQAGSCAGVFAPPEPADPQLGSCKKHADCTQGINGRCIVGSLGAGRGQTYYCVYDECATDADCDPGKVCYCPSGQAPQCFYQGNCQIDADCGGGAGGFCSPAYGFDCGGYHVFSGYYCHTPKDTCVDDSDCTGKDFCDYDVVVGRWECKSPNMTCAIG